MHWAYAAPLKVATPEGVGMSSERLLRVGTFIESLQAEKKIAGAVSAVMRQGQLVQLEAHGFADIESKRFMQTDDIFAVSSMTKPVATVAVLMLVEEQRILLSDPLEKFLPEFRDPKVAVAKADAPNGYILVPAQRSITIHDLMTHRSGFPGLPTNGSPAEVLQQQAISSLPPGYTSEQYVNALARAPLDSQPGTTWKYGASMTVLGRVIEVVSGQPLDVFLRERIFEPLGMSDTSFVVPAGKLARVVSAYTPSTTGLVKVKTYPTTTSFFSASGNLFSTATDYVRFCQMLLNGGELDGQRLISRKSVELMTAPHVEPFSTAFLRGHYYGLGVAVQKAGGDSGVLGSPGTYGWSGGYNTFFRIDPKEKLISLFLAQQIPSAGVLEQSDMHDRFQNAVMQAIVD
jgi:CubicO group peptidase (beta-lactamase class C family)